MAFFEQKSRVSTIQPVVAIDATIKLLDRVNMPLNIATNVSFEGKNEDGAVDSTARDNGTANAVEDEVIINGHAEQEATDDVALPPAAKYSELWIHLRHDFSR